MRSSVNDYHKKNGEWDRKMESETWRKLDRNIEREGQKNKGWKCQMKNIQSKIEYYFITFSFSFGTFLKLNILLLCAVVHSIQFNLQSLIRNMNV